MASPKGLEFSSSPRGFCVVSPWVTEHWANHGATREHYQPVSSVFSADCPTTTESTALVWNTYILKKAKKRPCFYAVLLINSIIFFGTWFSNWYVTHSNAKITPPPKQVGLITGGSPLNLSLISLPHTALGFWDGWPGRAAWSSCPLLCTMSVASARLGSDCYYHP